MIIPNGYAESFLGLVRNTCWKCTKFCSLIVIKLLFMRVLTINFIDMLYPSLTLSPHLYFYAFLLLLWFSLFIFNKRLYTYFWQQLWVWSIIFNSIIFLVVWCVWKIIIYPFIFLHHIQFFLSLEIIQRGKNYNFVNWTVKNCRNSFPLLKVFLIYNSIFYQNINIFSITQF